MDITHINKISLVGGLFIFNSPNRGPKNKTFEKGWCESSPPSARSKLQVVGRGRGSSPTVWTMTRFPGAADRRHRVGCAPRQGNMGPENARVNE